MPTKPTAAVDAAAATPSSPLVPVFEVVRDLVKSAAIAVLLVRPVDAGRVIVSIRLHRLCGLTSCEMDFAEGAFGLAEKAVYVAASPSLSVSEQEQFARLTTGMAAEADPLGHHPDLAETAIRPAVRAAAAAFAKMATRAAEALAEALMTQGSLTGEEAGRIVRLAEPTLQLIAPRLARD